ncbi:hypothetical protein BEN30_00850 [Magnetovibrio blakemorei]|uniref:DUF218 domain-containing protein n=1 Tax=Magnetovibrio blakemorei TaxID=28181 RepID=A0A1E5Q4B1_9PROT|nr:hypothetical protein BEN30_00850 [Magnetovibrio blakemorei]
MKKLLVFALNPTSLFIAGLILSFILLLNSNWVAKGRKLLGLVLLCYIGIGMFPVGIWALNKLEERFPIQTDPTHLNDGSPIAGILVLGGSVNTIMTRERNQVQVGGNIERLTEFMRLARLHPEAQLAYVGGQGLVFDVKPTEAEVSKRFLQELGMNTEAMWFEDVSRNTEEGAQISYERLQPGVKPWVLITSAQHMPRAVGLFRKAGWNILAYPVDYRTLPGEQSGRPMSWRPSWPGNLHAANDALYEWSALTFAWLRQKTDTLFPAPLQNHTLGPATNPAAGSFPPANPVAQVTQ